MVGVSGRLGLVFFDDQGQVRQTAVLAAAGTVCGVNIPCGLYHTVLALDPGTVMLEAKAGPSTCRCLKTNAPHGHPAKMSRQPQPMRSRCASALPGSDHLP